LIQPAAVSRQAVLVPLRLLVTHSRHSAPSASQPGKLRQLLNAEHQEGQVVLPQRKGIDLFSFLLPVLLALLIFLIAKFQVVMVIMLILLGVLVLAGLVYLIIMTTGHWSFG
jgi:uncharacterized membrane protein